MTLITILSVVFECVVCFLTYLVIFFLHLCWSNIIVTITINVNIHKKSRFVLVTLMSLFSVEALWHATSTTPNYGNFTMILNLE